MNGPSHFKKAVELLERSRGEELEWARLLTAQAQVHATLALVSADITLTPDDYDAWREVTQ